MNRQRLVDVNNSGFPSIQKDGLNMDLKLISHRPTQVLIAL